MILHVDMDAYYASVEERDRPELVGLPLIVGGSRTGRGVVAAANYVARKYGIRSAMPAAKAFRLCPQLISVSPRMQHYSTISQQIREIFFRFTPLVEPLSLDEAFLDVTGCQALFGTGPEIARKIKSAIFDETGLIASVGVAPNKFLAKIASDLQKPDGLVIVDPNRIEDFLNPLPVGRMWGVGKVTGTILDSMGVETIGDLRRVDPEILNQCFGSQGIHFHKLSQGIDNRKVIPDREAKSISHERTFETDITDRQALRAWTLELSDLVARRLRQHSLKGRTIQLKIRFSDFRTITRSYSLPEATNATDVIWKIAAELLDAAIPEQHSGIRLLGVGVHQFERKKKVQLSLFACDAVSDSDKKQQRLDSVADEIKDKFGLASLSRGSGIRHHQDQKKDVAGD